MHTLVIDGERVAGAGGELTVVEPATGEPMEAVAQATAADVDRAVAAAKAAQPGWADTPAPARAKILFSFAGRVRENVEELALLEARNAGKPIGDARWEANHVADTITYYAAAADKFFGETIPVAAGGLDFTLREPIGVVGLITPWNFPAVIATWKYAPALAAGNAVVLKPASLTPLSAIWLAEQALAARLPAGVLNVVVGPGATVGGRIVEHPDVDKIGFTGETTTGREILARAAARIARVGLELGGKSPNIVCADVDLEETAATAVASTFANAGQDCCARSRIIVEHSVHVQFVEALEAATKAVVVGPPLEEGTVMGPLITEAQRQRSLDYVALGRDEGARVVTGGDRLDGPGFFMTPAVLDDAAPSMRVVREEIFGPVATVMPFRSDDEAIAMANDTIYGLSGSVFCRDIGRALRFAKAVRSGVISVNTGSSVHLQAPFGGFKQSGLGRELGMKALESYTEVKNVYISLD